MNSQPEEFDYDEFYLQKTNYLIPTTINQILKSVSVIDIFPLAQGKRLDQALVVGKIIN